MTSPPLRILLCLSLCATAATAQRAPAPDLQYRVSTTMLLDTNLDHDETPDEAYGGVLGMGLEFRDRRDRPRFALRYEMAGHQYSIPAPWNRLSHLAGLALAIRPGRRVSLTTEAEVTLKGSSEDRDLGDQYQLRHTIGLRLVERASFEFGATVRRRRYAASPERNATNGYLEAELEYRLTRAIRLTGAGRAEVNEADSTRYRYDRGTLIGGLSVDHGFGRLELEGKVRRQHYRHRIVDDLEPARLRRDRRYQLSAEWTLRPWRSLDVVLGYEFENRNSNDPDRRYVAHQFGFTLVRTW
ncbi:MAG: outer membrane beta-barrel protein [Gemmatimonadales bacterium]|nr:outer membrane beta-barrel protein [Gemmatimonadales bacterium]